MKRLMLLSAILLLSACGPKIRLVPQTYMPVPPSMLMQTPKELKTIQILEKPVVKK